MPDRRGDPRGGKRGALIWIGNTCWSWYGLCRKEPDGRYVFDAPYYGRGTQGGGLCHAADCELLDPAAAHGDGKRIIYSEHDYPRMEQTVEV